jgi:hypothetical protein
MMVGHRAVLTSIESARAIGAERRKWRLRLWPFLLGKIEPIRTRFWAYGDRKTLDWLGFYEFF